MKITVAKAIIKTLEKAGVEFAFGYNGHGNWAMLDAIEHESRIRGIKTNAEDTAVHMADCFWRMRRCGPLPVVLTTVGPGNMNICAALANAFYESSAMLVLAGAGPTQWMDKGCFEECYRYGPEEFIQVVKPICKKAALVTRPDTALEIVIRTYKEAVAGRPGPAVVQIPFDIQHTEIELDHIPDIGPWTHIHQPAPDPAAIEKAVALIERAERPLLLAGSGVLNARASQVLEEIAEAHQIPVGTTFSAKGAVPEDHPLSVGTIDPSGARHGYQAARECDTLIAVGARFHDFNTLAWCMYQIPGPTTLIHMDIDPIELCRNYPTEVAVMTDARFGLEALKSGLASATPKGFARWRRQIDEWRAEWAKESAARRADNRSPLSNARILHDASEVVRETAPQTSVLFDTGNLLLFAPAFFTASSHRVATNNGHFARMGWSCGGALGAKLANPEHPSLAFIGDGSFMMTGLAISTAREHRIPVVWVVLNNRTIGIEREAMEALYGRASFCDSRTADTGELWSPDYVKLAESMGVAGRKIARAADFKPALKAALEGDAPCVLDVDVDPHEEGHRLAILPIPMNWSQPGLLNPPY
ncbi:MAG: thiamine pyrophosphate-binding protein [Candidatus Abyssubacteria bacterium]